MIRKLKFDIYTIGIPVILVLLMWISFWINSYTRFNFNGLGIYPREISGLTGILCSPFLHSNLGHLWSNTLPMIILGTALFYFFRYEAARILILAALISGVLTWLIGRESYHIGASGLIYFLASFLIVKGFIEKSSQLVALSFTVIFFYGSLVWYLFPIDDSISWEGHLAGAVAGIVLAFMINTTNFIVKPSGVREIQSNESDDLFMQQFDEHGNFIPFIEEEE